MHAHVRYRPTRFQRGVTAAAVMLAVLAGSGCGFSKVLDKRDVADRISRAYDVARHAGVASGKYETSLTILKLRLPVMPPGLKPGFTTKSQSVPMTIDVGQAKWAATADAGQGPQVVAAFDENVYYQYSADAGQARPYTAINLSRLYDDRQRRKGDAAGNNLLNPAYMFELLPGVLTGSVTTVGPDTIAGVATIHYRATFDASRAVEHASKDRQRAILTALDLMNVDNHAIKGEVWLDATGQPRKVVMHLRQPVERRIIVAINVVTEINHTGGGDPVPIPARELAAGTSDIGTVAPSIVKVFSRMGGGGGAKGGGAGL